LRILWAFLWHVAIAAAIVAAVFVAWRWWRRLAPRRRALPPAFTDALDPALTDLLATLDHRWTALGVARPPSRAPLEHAQGLPPSLRDASLPAVDCFYRGCFAGASLRPDEIAEARTAFMGSIDALH
jgi:hypothetical protein